jgi:DNA helicase-2/ATP-dependent DNA helicase PcrA
MYLPNPEQYLEGLNDEQKRAVTAADGPFLIVAGAGTGKTMAITRRIAWLIGTGRAKPEEILALTFTDKAAGEMVERVDRLLPFGYADLQISTFHSFCERLLKEHGLDIGLPTDFRLLNETDGYLAVRRAFDRFRLDYYRPLANPTKFIHALLKHFSRAKDEAVRPDEYLTFAASLGLDQDVAPDQAEEAGRWQELAGAYHEYQRLLLEQDSLDFGDLQVYAIELLRRRPAVLAELKRRFKYVLVDEFQDTNWAQYELVKLLVPPNGNLMVVGDDDQSIYKFRGASISNILQFKNDFPDAREVVLTRNYRSRQGILDLAYGFIRQNDPNRLEAKLAGPDGQGISKRLTAEREGEAAIEHLHFDSVEDEAEGVVKKIVAVKDGDPELTWSDFCVLVRSNAGAEDFSLALERSGVPYQFLALKGLYAKPVVMDVLAYFCLLDDYHESAAMYRTLNSPPYRIADADIVAIAHEAKRKAESLYEVCRRHVTLPGLADTTRATIDRLLGDLARHARAARSGTTEEILIRYLYGTDDDSRPGAVSYLKVLNAEDNQENRLALSYLHQLRKRIRRFEQTGDERTLKHFLEEFNLERESGEQGSLAFDPETGPDMVRLMTVHAAKGLEFAHVFIVSLVDKRFPSVARGGEIALPDALTREIVPEGDVHLEEERRLFYVAATRAKDGLYLTWADDYGGKAMKKPSRFLAELGFVEGQTAPVKKAKIERGFEEPRERAPGDPSPLMPPSHYSFSQLEAYRTCPLQYKYAHILRIPTFGRPAASFGSTMHATLQRFFEEINRRRSASQADLLSALGAPAAGLASGLPVTKDELLAMYDEAWVDDWYPNKATKEEWRAVGRRSLDRLYDETSAANPKTLFLEKEFTLKVGERALRGKIDRLDEMPDGRLEVIDYKTGTPKAEEDLSADSKRQLLIYQLAVGQCLGREAGGLTFHYLQDGSKASFLGTPKEMERLEAKIVEQVAAIESGDFSPKPGPQCRHCDFNGICPFRE